MVRQTIPGGSTAPARQDCPVELTALVLCRVAAPHIVRDLASGPKTFTELRTTIVDAGSISSRTLTVRLKALEKEGYVTRSALGGYRRRVEYGLSDKGRALVPVVEAMKEFGEGWLLDADCKELPESSL